MGDYSNNIPISKQRINRAINGALFLLISIVLIIVSSIYFENPLKRIEKPEFPKVHRYSPNVRVTDLTSGDLGVMSNNTKQMVLRSVSRESDIFGFANTRVKSDWHQPFQIIALGDSLSAFTETNQAQLWPSVLENISGLSVYNLAHPAEGPWHQLMNLYLEAGRIPKNSKTVLVWQLFSGNDLDDYYDKDTKAPILKKISFLEKIKGRIVEHWQNSYFILYINKWRDSNKYKSHVLELKSVNVEPMLFFDLYIQRAQRNYQDIQNHNNYPAYVEVVKAVKAECKKQGIQLMIVLFPSKPEVYAWLFKKPGVLTEEMIKYGFSKATRKLAAAENIPFLDLTKKMIKKSKTLYKTQRKFLWWTDDTHLNALGQRFAAEEIYKFLKRK